MKKMAFCYVWVLSVFVQAHDGTIESKRADVCIKRALQNKNAAEIYLEWEPQFDQNHLYQIAGGSISPEIKRIYIDYMFAQGIRPSSKSIKAAYRVGDIKTAYYLQINSKWGAAFNFSLCDKFLFNFNKCKL